MSVVTRFAPSPTGPLHIGGARTALFNFLYARGRGGKFLLRIEDTDRERSKLEFEREILDSLAWLGMDWDGEPLKQSLRGEAYAAAAEKLLSTNKAYRDYTPSEEVDALRQKAQEQKLPFRFREEMARKDPPKTGAPFAIRLRFPTEGVVGFDDLILGRIESQAKELDDLVIVRSGGEPVFHLCNVVDDVFQGTTHVIRGSDHQTNTLKHVVLYEALGASAPKFAHIPLIAGPDGKKLSKRDAARSTLEYREQGYLPEALVNFLARLGWSHGDQEIFSMAELIKHFDLGTVGKSMAAFNPDKLLWLNQNYIKSADGKRLAELMREHLRHEPKIAVPADEHLVKVATLQKERARTIRELSESSWYFFRRPDQYEEKGKKFLTPDALANLGKYAKTLKEVSDFHAKPIEAATQAFLTESNLPLKDLAQPLRVALTGGTVSPGIFEVLEVLGKDEALARIEQAGKIL